MHSKVKGNIGEAAIVLDLIKQGYPVFTELGDNSKVDLIVLIDNIPVKVQVKYRTIDEGGSVELKAAKAGPNYRFRYIGSDVDVFACYVPEEEIVFYVSASEVVASKGGLKFRILPSRSRNKTAFRFAKDYYSITDALKSYAPVAPKW